MNWILAAPFIHSPSDLWLGSFIPGTKHHIYVEPATYDHNRSRPATGISEWRDYFEHGFRVTKRAQKQAAPTGIITCFPQLAVAVGLCSKINFNRGPIVAWTFNIGNLHKGLRQRLSQHALSNVNCFVVHSTHEIEACCEWLDLPSERFKFVPLQRAVLEITEQEDTRNPFILAMGTANRDYKLLFEVLDGLKYPTIVVAGTHAVSGLRIPSGVTLMNDLTINECNQLMQRARINVIPIRNLETASGQVSLLNAMMFGRPTIVTECPGSADYVTHRKDALLVNPGDHDALKMSIAELWEDADLRNKLGTEARRKVIANYSDEAIGVTLGELLTQLDY